MTASLGADSEVGRLRTVMLHRPGPELQRLTPRNNDRLLFDGVPWVGRAQDEHDALAASLRPRDDFLIDPLPNLLFTRDSSVWVRDQVTITSLAMPARSRETQLTELIYSAHPRFAGTPRLHGWRHEHVEGGDVLLLAPGVLAIGVGERTKPAGGGQTGG